MRIWTMFPAMVLSAASVVACVGGDDSAPDDLATNIPGELTIDTESVTDFAASFRRPDGNGVIAIVRYSPTATYYELRTLSGVVLRSDGTEQVVRGQLDPRATSVDHVLPPGDPNYLAVVGLRNALVRAGTSAQPSAEERATTRYAAAYTASRLLGEVIDTSRWPYPGYARGMTLPPELREDGKGAPSNVFPNNLECCGPVHCDDCDYVGLEWSANNWCAAGDHCNAHFMWRDYTPGGNCGDELNIHRDSNIINYSGGPGAYCRSPWAAAATWRAGTAYGIGVPAGTCTQTEINNARIGTVNYWTCQGSARYLCDDHSNKILEICPRGCTFAGFGADDQCNGGGGPTCTATEIHNQTGSGSALPSIWTCQGSNRYVCDGRGFKVSEACTNGCQGAGFNHDDQCL